MTTTDTKILAAESCHWYKKDGTPCYEVPKAKGDGTRPTTLADARKLDLVPSVTTILQCAAKPGLEVWKQQQMMMAALTLPRIAGETEQDFIKRIIEDSKDQASKAAQRGSDLHTAIERYCQGKDFDASWKDHVDKVVFTLAQYGVIHLASDRETEHSFAHPDGFGGKVDWHRNSEKIIIDFKSKASITKDTKPYDEHAMQLAAYRVGIGLLKPVRAINVFVGVDDKEIRVFEHTAEDLERGWKMFDALLTYWKLSKNWKGQAQP